MASGFTKRGTIRKGNGSRVSRAALKASRSMGRAAIARKYYLRRKNAKGRTVFCSALAALGAGQGFLGSPRSPRKPKQKKREGLPPPFSISAVPFAPGMPMRNLVETKLQLVL